MLWSLYPINVGIFLFTSFSLPFDISVSFLFNSFSGDSFMRLCDQLNRSYVLITICWQMCHSKFWSQEDKSIQWSVENYTFKLTKPISMIIAHFIGHRLFSVMRYSMVFLPMCVCVCVCAKTSKFCDYSYLILGIEWNTYKIS